MDNRTIVQTSEEALELGFLTPNASKRHRRNTVHVENADLETPLVTNEIASTSRKDK
jgi:hypothetical protein